MLFILCIEKKMSKEKILIYKWKSTEKDQKELQKIISHVNDSTQSVLKGFFSFLINIWKYWLFISVSAMQKSIAAASSSCE